MQLCQERTQRRVGNLKDRKECWVASEGVNDRAGGRGQGVGHLFSLDFE